MAEDIEIANLDLRYEDHRLRDSARESKLLVSIQERGVETPLEGVDVDETRILLNGFKRYRCALKLGIGTVPYASLGTDEAAGIIAVLCASTEKSLSILEQAQFIDDLLRVHLMTAAEIADTLSRSKSWVAMRLGLVREVTGVVREKIFSGAFAVYSYMYTLRPFMRMDGVHRHDSEAFVSAVSGKKLSIREIDQLAHGYFRGPEWFRKEVDSGNLALVLEQMKEVPESPDRCGGFEGATLRHIESLAKCMQQLIGKSQDRRLVTPSRTFCAQANLLLVGILGRMTAFHQTLKDLHDRTGTA